MLEARRLDHSIIDAVGYRLIEPDGRRLVPELLARFGVAGPAIGELQRAGSIQTSGRTVRLSEVSEPRRGQRFGFVWTPGCATPSTPWGTVAARRWLRNSGDADPAEDLLTEDLPEPVPEGNDDTDGDGRGDSGGGQCGGVASVVNDPEDAAADADTESVAARLAIRTPCATACADSRNTPADPFSGRGMSPNCVWRSKYTAV